MVWYYNHNITITQSCIMNNNCIAKLFFRSTIATTGIYTILNCILNNPKISNGSFIFNNIFQSNIIFHIFQDYPTYSIHFSPTNESKYLHQSYHNLYFFPS
jgi:hypothetical protein